ncbi:MAG TPA: serine/threonine-protein kinase [Kofleriaceae bacterium]|nr:serine/threonine-protein kinase [Kofleriaceae bacterium]
MSGTDDEVPPPRRTRRYGAVDPDEQYPPTIADATPEPIAPIAAGDKLARYRVTAVLGRGGMGEVVSARDEQIGRQVAVKRLRVASPTPEVLARFLREARIQGRLEHPAVVPVHELHDDGDGPPYFVMKQLTGTTLADVLPRLAAREYDAMAKFPHQRLLRAFADACLAIEFAHTRGVVHRDLKPANIVLGDFGEVYVLDWGIAKVDGESERAGSFADIDTAGGSTETVAGAILGTPGYISPEQIRGDHDLDGRADVYALGCILFELLALVPLHPRGQAGLASALAGADARASVIARDRELPPELDAICVRATAVDREARYQTARQLAEAVVRFLDGNRDVALRRELARSELAHARAALAIGDFPAQRREALRAAARALALDPTDREPADLVGALMLDPPQTVPAEVEHELAELDLRTLRTSARFGIFAAIAYLAFFPMLYWIGFRDVWYLVAGPAISLAIIAVELWVAPKNPFWSGYLAIAGNLAMFALFAWMISPIVIGPGPAIVMVTLLAAHRRLIRPWLLAALTALATMFPWLLELAGWRAVSTTTSGSAITLHTAAGSLDPLATIIGMAIYVTALAHLAALLSRLQDDERRAARVALQLQSWQLRQLVPKPTSIPPAL